MTRHCKFTYNSFFYNKGDVAQCCMQDAPDRKTVWSDIKSLDDFYINNNDFTAIRQSMDDGIEHTACRSCWVDERMYGDSMRINNTYYSDNPETFGIKHVDLRLSNKCNLQCKMCNPHDSSQLAQLAIDLDETDIQHPLYNKIPKDESFDNEILLTHILQLPNLETIRFAGGEPFIMPEVINFLTTLIHYGKTDISVEFITNCTSTTQKMVSILEQFKNVTMICSIDGVNDTIEYQRYPAKWSIIESSFKRLYNSKIHSIRIAPCIGLLNYLTLDKLFNWATQFPNAAISYNEIYEPTFLNFRYIPISVRSQFYDNFSSIDLTHASPKWQQFKQTIMYETLEPTIEDCTMLYRYSTRVWDVNCKHKFLDLYPWAEYMIEKAVK